MNTMPHSQTVWRNGPGTPRKCTSRRDVFVAVQKRLTLERRCGFNAITRMRRTPRSIPQTIEASRVSASVSRAFEVGAEK